LSDDLSEYHGKKNPGFSTGIFSAVLSESNQQTDADVVVMRLALLFFGQFAAGLFPVAAVDTKINITIFSIPLYLKINPKINFNFGYYHTFDSKNPYRKIGKKRKDDNRSQ
jgi:hypothetical protein